MSIYEKRGKSIHMGYIANVKRPTSSRANARLEESGKCKWKIWRQSVSLRLRGEAFDTFELNEIN